MYSENNSIMIKERQKRCVCKMCGGNLEIRMIIYNQYGGQGLDLYCPQCEQINFGIEPEIYALASKFVDEFEFNYYTDMVENERNRRLNIAKICDISAWILKKGGLLTDEGLKTELIIKDKHEDKVL